MDADAIIVGGGIAGLTAAVGLVEGGLRVVVIEKTAELGGRAKSWTDETTGDRVDIGPHVLATEYHNMLALLERLGTRDEVVWHTEKFIALVHKPRPIEIRAAPLPVPFHFLPSLLRAPTVSRRDLLSNLRVTWFALRMLERDVGALDALNADEFLRRMGVTDRFIRWFWATAAMTIMNVPLERCSAGALMRFFRQLIGHRGYHPGFPANGLGDLFAPAAAARLEAAGGRLMMNTEVKALERTDRAFFAAVLDDNSRVEGRRCIAAVPPAELRAMLPDQWVRETAVFRTLPAFQPSPYISCYLWFGAKLTGERFWARTWSPTNLNYDFYDLSNIRPGWADRPSLIASNIIYSHRAEGLSDEQIVAVTRRELADFAPQALQAPICHARVHRISMAIPLPLPGMESLRPPSGTPFAGLFLAGDWTATHLPASMEGAVRSGWLAAEAVLAEVGRPRRLALPIPEPEGLARWLGTGAQRHAT